MSQDEVLAVLPTDPDKAITRIEAAKLAGNTPSNAGRCLQVLLKTKEVAFREMPNPARKKGGNKIRLWWRL